MFNPNPYYMAARRYEISLRVGTSEILFKTREEKFRISKRPCNVLFIIKTPNNAKPYERRDLLCSNSNGDLVRREEIVFFRESLPGISWVFI